MFVITDDDILSAEKLLLQPGEHFDTERSDVIKCLDQKDVVACPGSGKTTALLAKLLIISRQIPLPGNRGICVLTHTNVAIDSITAKIGPSADRLFQYPNHFGTIQSFVDKYLTIPSYVERCSRRPDKIDNEWYQAKVTQQKKYLGRKGLHFCHTHSTEYRDFLTSLCFRDLTALDERGCLALKLDFSKPEDKEIYDALLSFKNRVLSYGILSYDDAYHLAFDYLRKHPNLKALFSLRFAWVFIDEMQDTNSDQINLLDGLFDHSVIIQRIGDINQSIYGFDSTQECYWKPATQNLRITSSKRFSNSIAKVLSPVCVTPQVIKGNPSIPDITPTIIAFSDNNILKVIPRYGDLIVSHDLHLKAMACFKAVGWVAKPNDPDKHTLPSYWPDYEKASRTDNSDFPNLASYVTRQGDNVIQRKGAKEYRRAILRALLKCLRIVDQPKGAPIRTEGALFRYIEQKDQDFLYSFNTRTAEWCLSIYRNQLAVQDIRDFIIGDFASFFGIDDIQALNDFLNGISSTVTRVTAVPSRRNTYTHNFDGKKIEIDISTVHGVKGETHTATLYLETFYHKYDIARIIEYLKGNYTNPGKPLIRSNLRVAHVGMSRPSHLLCVAVHQQHLVGHEDALQASGWDIDSVLVT